MPRKYQELVIPAIDAEEASMRPGRMPRKYRGAAIHNLCEQYVLQ